MRALLLCALALAAAGVATCQSASPEAVAALAPFLGTAQAPFSQALLNADSPVQDVFADSPIFDESTLDPPLAASSAIINDLLNDPELLALLDSTDTLDEVLGALPPADAEALQALLLAPATGDLDADLESAENAVNTAGSSRKLLRA